MATDDVAITLTAEQGALTKARFARDAYLRYVRERASVAPTLDQLAGRHGVPRPVVDGGRMVLSRAAASNAGIFRRANAKAEANGPAFEVESFEQAFGGNNNKH